MTSLMLLRHGQSEWNRENRFTGWVDVDLSEEGVKEAKSAGKLLKASGVEFSAAYASVLKRAVRTLWIALDEMDRMWLPEAKSWRLNERHYGALTGLNKKETADKHGAEQVQIWRRSFDVPPPPLDAESPYNPAKDPRYAGVPRAELPLAESLKTTLRRVEPYWRDELAPRLQRGQSLLVAAHGNSLRALVKLLMKISDNDIVHVEIPTGNPLQIDLAESSLTPVGARYLDEARAETLPALSGGS
ncbi:MAG TPA: 2,3-diphosphoglycerate-dependent phosphoglycerate mutase [Parvularculaceae bacterium]|nr:2,3-diphosphoglycerate-dependent phosphoglycerate mutase [Parvularculaceae bacterium]